MGEHATESNSLSGKSLPHVNELSVSLEANEFCPISLQPSFNSFLLCELDFEENPQFSHFLFASLCFLFFLPTKTTVAVCSYPPTYVMDVLHPLNQTPLVSLRVLTTLECM